MVLSQVQLHLTSERSPFYLPLGFVLDPALAVEARHERESSLPPREWECGEMCVMGWMDGWMCGRDGIKLDELLL